MRDRSQLGSNPGGTAAAAAVPGAASPRVVQRGSSNSDRTAAEPVAASTVQIGANAVIQCHAHPSEPPGIIFSQPPGSCPASTRTGFSGNTVKSSQYISVQYFPYSFGFPVKFVGDSPAVGPLQDISEAAAYVFQRHSQTSASRKVDPREKAASALVQRLVWARLDFRSSILLLVLGIIAVIAAECYLSLISLRIGDRIASAMANLQSLVRGSSSSSFADVFFSPSFQSLLGIAGTITGLSLYISPLPTFIDIFKKRSADKHSSAPYLCGLLSSCVWTIYGSPVVANAFSVFAISVLGLLFNGTYCLIFYLFSTEHKGFIGAVISSIVLGAATMASLTVSVIPAPVRPVVFGLTGDCTSIASFAAPLTAVAQMMQTQSVEFFPIQLCAVSLVHTIVWTAFGTSTSDIFVAVPNFLGLLLSAAQVLLYLLYRRSTPRRISSLPIRTSAADTAAAAATIASYTTPLIPPSASNPPSPLPALPGGRPSFVAAAAAAASAMASAASAAAAAHAGRLSTAGSRLSMAGSRGSQEQKVNTADTSEAMVVAEACVSPSVRRSGYTRLSSSDMA